MTKQVKNWIYLLIVIVITVASCFLIYNPNTKKVNIKLGLDLRSGTHIAVQLLPTIDYSTNQPIPITDDIIENSIGVFEKRLNPEGNKEILIQKEGEDRLIIEIPEETDVRRAEELVKKVGLLEFKEQDIRSNRWKTVLTGADLKPNSAKVGIDQAGKSYVSLEFNQKGAKRFGEVTKRNIKRPIAIYFDKKEISAPVVQQAILTGSCTISGENMTPEECENLRVLMNSGSLRANVKILESMTVDPMLGQKSLTSSLEAGIVGLIIVGLFMLYYYRLPGLTADLALIVYTIVSLATMVVGGFVMTLPGIAGFILAIGMAVDANVLIFERIKEELWDEKSLEKSIDIGFKRAFVSILDSHVTTFIGAWIIYALGATSMKGFGLTLMIGTFWSLITNTAGTKVFLDTFFLNNIFTNNRKMYGE